MVVEDDLLDVWIECHLLQLAEPRGARRLDDDQPPDLPELEPRDIDGVELVGVEAVELADVSVERAGNRDDGRRVQPPGGQHRREGIEVGVPVGGDDFGRFHTRDCGLGERYRFDFDLRA